MYVGLTLTFASQFQVLMNYGRARVPYLHSNRSLAWFILLASESFAISTYRGWLEFEASRV